MGIYERAAPEVPALLQLHTSSLSYPTPPVEGCRAHGVHAGLDWSSEVALVMSLKQRFLPCTAMTQQGNGLPGPGLSPHEELKGLFIHGNPHQHQTKQGSVESEAAHTNPSHSLEERASAPTHILLHNSSQSPCFKAVVNHLCARNEMAFVSVSVFLELKRKCLGLKRKMCFKESFLKVFIDNNCEH